MKRKAYKPKDKINGPALTHMREVAFGRRTDLEIFRTCKRAIELRDDQQMLADAQARRDRKNARRARQA